MTEPMTQLKVVGQRVAKSDAPEKVTGTARYSADMRLPGMLFGRLLRSPHAHARITKIDTTKAEALPGVEAVLHFGNTPRRCVPISPFQATAPETQLPPDQLLFDDTVRYAGQAVAAVAAIDQETADRAVELIEVEYELLPVVTDPIKALEPDAPIVNSTPASKGNLKAHLEFKVGDVEAGFAEADIIVEGRFRTPKQKHAQMEPWACLAAFDAAGRLTVWSPNQSPHPVRKLIADLFGLPISKVRMITPPIGGGFGGRMGLVGEKWAVALAEATRRPVKIVYSRSEDFVEFESRNPMIVELKIGARQDGSLTAIQAKTWTNAGAYTTQSTGITAVHGLTLLRTYRVEHRSFDGYIVYTNTPVSGAYRGYGGPQAAFALEQLIDELAERLGRDPLEYRKQIAAQKGDLDFLTQLPIATCALPEALDAGAAAIGWQEKRGRRRQEGPWVYGVGAASCMWVSGTGCMGPGLEEGSGARVRLSLDGTVDVVAGATDLGTGIGTTLAQIAAEALGIAPENVRVVLGDTDVTPYDVGAHASRTLFNSGNALIAASDSLREQILNVAADMLEASPADLELADGHVGVRGVPDRRVSLADVANTAFKKSMELTAGGYSPQTNAPPYAAHFAEVAVNVETGQVRLINYVAAHDIGRAINPTIVEGQVEGGVFHGIGFALSEDFLIDENTGSPLNATFMDYKVLTANDIPYIKTILLEDPDPSGPFGAKGVGEVGLLPVAAAIANAIYDATGVRVRHAPMTPEHVLRALHAQASAS